MKCRAFLFLCLVSGLSPVKPQEAPPPADASYLVPQTVFVGDPGRLVLPLSPLFGGVKAEVLDDPEALPRLGELTLTRVELETRGELPRLLVDFTAFVPGSIELPPIEIASLSFKGLRVNIASILEAEGNSRVLSGPAAPLAAPGTGLLLYGAIFGLILFGILLTAGGIRGIPGFARWLKASRRRRLIRSMTRVLRQLRNRVIKGPPGGEGEALARFSAEFRVFLGLFLGMNCRAMTAGEFRPLLAQDLGNPLSGLFLCDLLRRCDALRFGGGAVESGEALAVFDTARVFTDALERADKAGPGKDGRGGGT
jgi:hypothetical protein